MIELFAAEGEIGGNLLAFGLAVVTLLTVVVNSYFARKNALDQKALAAQAASDAKAAAADSKTAAEQSSHASAQLRNNGGSTALDKLEAGQKEILGVLKFHDDRLTRMEVTISRPTTVSTPLPPPPPPQYLPLPGASPIAPYQPNFFSEVRPYTNLTS